MPECYRRQAWRRSADDRYISRSSLAWNGSSGRPRTGIRQESSAASTSIAESTFIDTERKPEIFRGILMPEPREGGRSQKARENGGAHVQRTFNRLGKRFTRLLDQVDAKSTHTERKRSGGSGKYYTRYIDLKSLFMAVFRTEGFFSARIKLKHR
jgi:hypothetical protein